MRWLNGGGETTELAVSPEHATFDTFDWRLSAAHVAIDGPFSSFPGIDRSLIVTSGAGLTLVSQGLPSTTCTPDKPPLEFPGDRAIQGVLVDGPVSDLNVMTRRGRYAHKLVARRISDQYEIEGASGILIVSLRDCAAQCEYTSGIDTLRAGDFAILQEGEGPRLTITPESESLLYEIRLWPV
jgi:environmental stress-induced protein Ves